MPLPDWHDLTAVAAWRAAMHAAWGEGTVGDEVLHRPERLGGVDVLVAGPPAAAITLVYAHGGGYALGSAGVAVPITARLARHVRVVSVDYRLAPEHPFPAALDDVDAVFQAVYRSVWHGGGGFVAVAGDSAGGALALGVALRAAAGARPARPAPPARPAAVVLFCPHLEHQPDDAAAPAGGPAALAAAYRAGHDAADPLLSPLHAPPELLAQLPPTLVQAGSADPLHQQAVRFARRGRAAGAPVTLDLWDGLWHAWQYHRELPEADRALAEASRFLLSAERQSRTP